MHPNRSGNVNLQNSTNNDNCSITGRGGNDTILNGIKVLYFLF